VKEKSCRLSNSRYGEVSARLLPLVGGIDIKILIAHGKYSNGATQSLGFASIPLRNRFRQSPLSRGRRISEATPQETELR
jgi:hypothetical protein